ncbi:MAG TPA: sigma 54-interacting transcriptional regulator [Patescibacteria group bacterium]|nr:sigma 54-interacting transcriptional regulator [Patescibacteria group bacterium]
MISGTAAARRPAERPSKPMHSELFAPTLARIAQAVAGALELREVFESVANAASAVLPFDVMVIGRLEPTGQYTMYAISGEQHELPGQYRPDDYSPAIRIDAGKDGWTGCVVRIEDGEREFDGSFAVDRLLLERGIRSGLRVPLVRDDRVAGVVSFWARRPGLFNADHEAMVRPIASLLGLALEHERLWNLDASRRRKFDVIDTLLPMMAASLDVRSIFNGVSEVVKPVIPHDRLVLTSFSEDRREITFDAISGEPTQEFPPPLKVAEGYLKDPPPEYVLIRDVNEEEDNGCGRHAWCKSQGARSLLKIPFRLDRGGLGSLIFVSAEPRQYSEEDVPVARRVADHVSLALSHQRLAEEERKATEARERAAHLEERVQALRDELASSLGYRRVVGESRKWKAILTQATKVANTETTVLLTGESGTGKEVVARFVHRGSPRARGPFVALNCAALPENLLESELFGHEKGAFTGAVAAHPGRLEQAAGGVLFLDEVGEMTPAVQAKLLRVLQEKEFQRLGATRTTKTDVRIVAATNRDLEAAMGRGMFREDLYYRLRVFEIRLPPLRERREDILPMAEAFLEEIGPAVGRPAAGIARDAREALLSYAWPGNARELRNALERATILCDGGLITLEHLPLGTGRPGPLLADDGSPAALPGGAAFPAGGVSLDGVERDLITKALRESKNNRSRAARLLGITRSQLYSRMQKHGLGEGSAEPRG